ncbi:hypothetical protein N7U66_18640 [Lacinutrix neustonica]|uniref:Uncharacterized protein n=1 Tax=Lacinutrix neustonica TaxID=2980107 RepID=A0A9E8MX27_9FLAO|nr:hypothetical protein [Lacinutrix neustonica]WAC01859.1 hypothetical protein N7U66_18640 [Lacinutrix neustonica]
MNFRDSCQSNENNSLWLEVTVTTAGILAFTITPNSTSISEDYDFFIFGPNTTCGNLGPTIRCSTTNPSSSGQANNLTGLSTTETDNFEGPGPAGNSFVSAINAAAGDTYFIVIDRPIGNSPFSLTWTGNAQFAEAPESDTNNNGQVLDLTDCDSLAPFNDGQTPFDLDVNTPLMIGSQNNVAVAYYESESDANIAVNALSSPYISTANGQTIYATITNTTTGCFSIQEFQLFITSQPTISASPNLVACDDSSNNGIETFNLNAQNNTVLGSQNPTDFNITYHVNQLDADGNLNPLASPYTNTSNPQTIFVRMEDAINSACYATAPFDLIVNNLPIITSIPDYPICDDNTDGFYVFNLTSQDGNIINGQANVSVSYYESDADANSNINAIANPTNYTNITASTQVIYVRLGSTISSCFSISSFEIIVNPLPLVTPIPRLRSL